MGAYGAAELLDRAGIQYACFDQARYPGGHTATFVRPDGFAFDDGPHLSFTKDPRIQALLADNVDGDYQTIQIRIDNLWQGRRLTHPAQVNLYPLPPELLVKIVTDFVTASEQGDPPNTDYRSWSIGAYGRTFAETFPLTYARKYHTTDGANLTTDWLGPRFYRPSLEELLEGALIDKPRRDVHYVTHFRYPTHGGFAAYLAKWFTRATINLDHRLIGVDPAKRLLRFANGATIGYERLISSLPLPELIRCIDDAPQEVQDAAARLSFSTAVIVNVGVARESISDTHITYFYDEDVSYARLNFPSMLSPNVVPPGHSSIQAEVYRSDRYRPLDEPVEAIEQQVMDDLIRTGILTADDRIVCRESRVVRYANVIYDHERRAALDIVHGYLDEVGIAYCGRYGDWDHSWTDEAFVSGERAAERTV